MEDLALCERFVDVVAGGDEEEGGKDEGEDCEGCRVPDAEERDVVVRVGNVHGKDMGIACMIGIMMLGCCFEVGWRAKSTFGMRG